jgi:hypothetical protein
MAEEEKKKRHRRTKKEMEAARRLEAASKKGYKRTVEEDGNSSEPVAVESTTRKKIEELFVLFYCFHRTSFDVSLDRPGQIVCIARWNDDGTVLCPRCNQHWLFDGEHFFDAKGRLHFWIDDKGYPGGHFFRYDLVQRGWRSPKQRPIGKTGWKPFDFQHEFNDAIQILGPEIAVGASAFTSKAAERDIPVVTRRRVQNGKSRKSADGGLRKADSKPRKATGGSTGKRRGRPPKMAG